MMMVELRDAKAAARPFVSAWRSLARAPIHVLDFILRRATRVFEFTDDPDCILRTRVGRAARAVHLPEGTVPAGEKVMELHLWGERIRPIPREGATLSYAVWARRAFVGSLRLLARYVEGQPDLVDVAAVCGVSVLISPDYTGGTAWMERLGFTILPCRTPLGRFGEFWENLYAWSLMWAFNPASIRHRNVFAMRRREMWMMAEAYFGRYGMGGEADRERR